ncbi:MAG: hypothetical protein IJU48_11825 [Synergistaceae bacterium]|nr:hypothetical protein [Synergistaceae bacterium]
MRKIFIALTFLLLAVASLHADNYDISGLWNIEGKGFAKDSSTGIKLNAQIDGDMRIYTALASEISQDLASNDYASRDVFDTISNDLLSPDKRFLTGYTIYVRIDLSKLLSYKVWDYTIPNGIKIPAPLPEMRPSNDNPYKLLEFGIDNEEQNMNYSIILTSITSGKIIINGIIKDVEVVGDVEVDSESVIWLNGTEKPDIDSKVDSGCNSAGYGIISLALILFFRSKNKNVWN